MTESTIDDWESFWSVQYDSGGRIGRIEASVRAPLRNWLTLDVGLALESEIALTVERLRAQPDQVLSDARDGFEQFVANEPELPEPPAAIDDLAVHLVGLPVTARDERLALGDPIAAAGTLTSIVDVAPLETPETVHRATRVTYRCPAGHETTIEQPIHRYRTLDRCGTAECSNDVFVDDARTRSRPVLEFEVEHRAETLRCLGTGRTASEPDRLAGDRLAGDRLAGDRLRLIGIPRLRTHEDGSTSAVYDVNAVQRIR